MSSPAHKEKPPYQHMTVTDKTLLKWVHLKYHASLLKNTTRPSRKVTVTMRGGEKAIRGTM
jgi:hypothetical protein